MPLTPSPESLLRNELQDYMRSCERLLSSAHSITEVPLSDEELEIVAFYVEELKTRLLTRQAA